MATLDDTAAARAQAEARLLAENAAALDSSNRDAEQHGLPLEEVRAQLQADGKSDGQTHAELFNILLASDAVAGLKDALAGRLLSEEETETLLHSGSPPTSGPPRTVMETGASATR